MVPFRGSPAETVNIAATTTSARVAMSNAVAAGAASRYRVRVYNAGTVPVFIEDGGSTVTANTANDMPLAPGAVEVLTLGGTHVAAITASGSATVYFTPGDGI